MISIFLCCGVLFKGNDTLSNYFNLKNFNNNFTEEKVVDKSKCPFSMLPH